jgi:3-methyladenine DNA glycosylase AlkD
MAPADLFSNVEPAAEEISRRLLLLEGSTTESIRRLRREFSKRLAKSAPRFVVDVALGVCRLLVEDRDDMVVKAMSWALRELSKRDPTAVRQFLDEFQHAIAARVVREVGNKLSTGLKNPRERTVGESKVC